MQSVHDFGTTQNSEPLSRIVDYQGTEQSPVVLHENRFFRMLHNGRFHYLEGVRYPQGVVMVPVLPNGDLVMVNVRRLPIVGVSLEFPRGGVELGEELNDAAQRETIEETAYLPVTVRQIGRVAAESATINSIEAVFRVDVQNSIVDTGFDKSEIESVRVVSRKEFRQLVSSGVIICGHTLAAFTQLMIHEMEVA